jgi:hypothetical protein
MAVREIRTFRLEDWEGNIYKPEGLLDKTVGSNGSSVGASSIIPNGTGLNSTHGAQIGDNTTSTGTAIILNSSNERDLNLATVHFTDLTFGMYGVNIRSKISRAYVPNILRVNTYYVDLNGINPSILLSTTDIGSSHYREAYNIFRNVGFVTEFRGKFSNNMALKVEVILKRGSGVNVVLDSITTSRAFTAVSGAGTMITIGE